MSTTVESSAKKRVSESEASKPEKLKRDAIEDDFDAALSEFVNLREGRWERCIELEKLCDSRTRIQQSVNAATRNEEQIKADVQKWLRNADLVIAEAEEFDFEVQLNRRCFSGWCPDWMSRGWWMRKNFVLFTIHLALLSHGIGGHLGF
ncbi:hypothetical protein LOK49_LG06G02952 [Camellia lanceoleosa]|uniref:Uncharacterized protein n=1 Tax=Camellia lanceoleosa TaxID=1840588 RepID=A0ACC0HCJ5_9ERIC|nr:hypothetical protein LOK49_LG06G02952 [Camellia lanceoleosa]